MSIVHIDNHVEQAKDRIIQQYKGKQRVEKLVETTNAEIQVLEDTFRDLSVDRAIDNAEGVQLDGIGSIVGIARLIGQSDEDYRIDIKTKIIQNLNQGTPEEIINAAKFLLGTTYAYYLEVYPAQVDIFTTVEITDPVAQMKYRSKLETFLPAGVRLVFGWYDADDGFLFDSPDGFGDDLDPDVGGLFSEIYGE